MKAGLAVSQSEGTGSFHHEGPEGAEEPQPRDDAPGAREEGGIESSLSSVYPYLGYIWGEDGSVWGFVGWGEGDMMLTTQRGEDIETNIAMRMGAVGAKTGVMRHRDGRPLDLTLETDALYVQMRSEEVPGQMSASKTHVSRLRARLEASRGLKLGEDLLTPSLQVGVRNDVGDAEEGLGIETGARLTYRGAEGLSLEGAISGLVLHEDEDYEEWSTSVAIGLEPSTSGRGLSFSVRPTWGDNAGNGRLWDTQVLNELSNDGLERGGSRWQTEIGYGLSPFREPLGVVTPYLGLEIGGERRRDRAGARWAIAPNARLGVELSRTRGLDGGREEHALMLRGGVQW